MAISLTESAAQRVRNQLASRGRGLGLRVGIKTTGCSGYSYVVDYADEARADDTVFESQGVKLFVDGASLPAIDGTQDFALGRGLADRDAMTMYGTR